MENKFKVLFLALPRVVYDRSLHDRCTDFGETAQYVINKFKDKNVQVDIFDGAIPISTYRHIYRKFAEKYDLVVFYADVTEAHIVKKHCKILKYISPTSQSFIFGDATLTIPHYFGREPFNAIHICGDQEVAISSYIEYLTGSDKSCLKGLSIYENGKVERYMKEVRLSPEEWAFPPLDLLPIDKYKEFAKMYKGSSYACSVYVSKGCPKKCKYCLCVPREGIKERRRPVKELVDFLEANKDNFSLFKLHSADFLLDTEWVKKFCTEVINRNLKIAWKTTTCFNSMSEDIVKLCAEAGCVGMGFGVETFYKSQDVGLKLSIAKFEKAMSVLSKYKISYKGYIMLGLNDQSLEDIEYTIELLEKNNIKVRPSTYTPFQNLISYSVEELDKLDLESWNKKECIQIVNKDITEEQIYRILFDCKL